VVVLPWRQLEVHVVQLFAGESLHCIGVFLQLRLVSAPGRLTVTVEKDVIACEAEIN
jgi:hypothetical protein